MAKRYALAADDDVENFAGGKLDRAANLGAVSRQGVAVAATLRTQAAISYSPVTGRVQVCRLPV